MPSRREFYPPEYTQASRTVLTTVHDTVPNAVLIGGWGTWVRTGGPMSHDIDLIVTRPELAVLRAVVEDLSESRHLAGRKWRATLQGVHLDLYVPHQSRLGAQLQLRTERLTARRETIDGWVVLDAPAHLATKLAALLDRPDTTPGDKDRHEIMALFDQGVDDATAVEVLHQASARPARDVTELITQAFGYLGDLELDRNQRRALNQRAHDWHRHSLHHQPPPSPEPGPDRRRRGPSLEL